MRNFSPNLLNALDQTDLNFYILVELFLNNTYRITDAPFNIAFNGNTYLANQTLYSYDPPRTSTYLNKDTYKVGLVDQDHTFQAEARLGVNGRKFNVYAVVEDINNQLLLNPSDVIVVYKGFVDRISFTNDMKDKIGFIEGASPVAKLDMVKPIITSKDDMDLYSLTDTSYDQIYKDAEVQVKWGKS
jgi:hypothetical protein